MKTSIIVLGVSMFAAFGNPASATIYKCEFKKDGNVVASCPVDSKNPNQTCEYKHSASLQGTCAATDPGGGSDLVVCAFHDPKIKATEAIQSLSGPAKGEAKIMTPAGFMSGAATIAKPVQAIAIGYVEKTGASELAGGCRP